MGLCVLDQNACCLGHGRPSVAHEAQTETYRHKLKGLGGRAAEEQDFRAQKITSNMIQGMVPDGLLQLRLWQIS
jgi:hypothetical protein